eukprot:1308674-Alexandrium_andersonii.AAC.2
MAPSKWQKKAASASPAGGPASSRASPAGGGGGGSSDGHGQVPAARAKAGPKGVPPRRGGRGDQEATVLTFSFL